MKWKNTWILVGLAGALLLFIMLVERRLEVGGVVAARPSLFAPFHPLVATTVQLRRGNEFALVLEQTNDTWRFNKPFAYPASGLAVQKFLEALERIVPATRITSREIQSRKQTMADFGFDTAPVVIALERGAERRELRVGARTPAGDQVYVEIVGQPGVAVIDAALLDLIPRTPHDWRDPRLFALGGEPLDRAEIVHRGAGFVLQLDATNKLWRLTRPAHRAEQVPVAQLLKKILEARALEFVTDSPAADLEAYGLLTPEFEVTLGQSALGRKVHFGRSPTNDPTRVYARLLTHNNVVLVPKAVVDVLATPYAELRERQLISFAPELVDVIEVRGEENFIVRKDATGAWKAGEGPADPNFTAQWLTLLSQLETTEFVKDVVTDFASYGLAPGQRHYTLRTTVTNALGATNIVVAQLALGTNGASERAFARRTDEDSVYAIRPLDYSRMPGAAWQFRDHRLWNFTTNQVMRIASRQTGGGREAVRQPNGEWVEVRGWNGDFNPFALEEMAGQLGELRAMVWIARGAGVRERYGFTADSPQVSVELRGEKPQTLTVEFGGLSPLRLPYALTTVEGQPVVFEFPWSLYADLQRNLGLSPTAPTRPRAAPPGQ